MAGSTQGGNPVFQRLNASGDGTSNYFTLDSQGNQQTVLRGDSNSGVTWNNPPSSNQVQLNQQVHADAATDITLDLQNQGARVQTNISMRGPGTAPAVADAVVTVTGAPNGTLNVPQGYAAFDFNGNPVNSIPLNAQGTAVIEVKTGGGDYSNNQAAVYPCCEAGTAEAFGGNAKRANVDGPLPQTTVTTLRPR